MTWGGVSAENSDWELLFMFVLLSSVHNFHFKWEVRNPEAPIKKKNTNRKNN